MSASIDIFKLKFSVFGHGFEDTRADSGDGHATRADKINYAADYACIDSTGQYLWLASASGIKKYDLLDDDLSEVAQTAVADNTSTILMHPSNVANNYGIAFQGTTCTIFDLTNDSVVITDTVTYTLASMKYDCVLNGTEVQIVSLQQGRSNNKIYTLAMSDLTMTEVSLMTKGVNGFVDIGKISAYQVPRYGDEYIFIYGLNIDGTTNWTYQAPSAGGSAMPNYIEVGWGADGLMWNPCYKYGKWRMGGFKWTSASGFATPMPFKVFGTFPARPIMLLATKFFYAHSTGRTRTAFSTDQGVYAGDYHDMIKVTDDANYTLACDENTVIAYNPTDHYTYIYR